MNEISKIANSLVFEPILRYGKGDEMQVARTTYKNTTIYERTFIPWNIFKKITVSYDIDLVLLMGTEPCLSADFYTDDGYGIPVVKTLEEAIVLIDKYKP